MTLKEAVREWLENYDRNLLEPKEGTPDLAERIERYGMAMHDRGNSARMPWGYVPPDRQEKARHAAVAAFQGGDG